MKYNEIDWKKLTDFGRKLVGKPYKLGQEIDIRAVVKNPDLSLIPAIDCSELVELLYAMVGIYIEDGSYNQVKYTYEIKKDDATIGDLGFKANPDNGIVHHVGVLIDDGMVLEAKGLKWGVVLTPKADYEASSHFLKWGRHKIISA